MNKIDNGRRPVWRRIGIHFIEHMLKHDRLLSFHACHCAVWGLVLFAVMVSGSRAWSAVEPAIRFSSLIERLTDLSGVYQAPDGDMGVVVSQGNEDDDAGGEWYAAAELPGPGAVTRIWSSDPRGRFRLYIDDAEKPLVECDFDEVFQGGVEPFKKPFVYAGSKSVDAAWSYVPIPYSRRCRIELNARCPYQIDYALFLLDASVEPLSLPLSKADAAAMTAAAKAFTPASKEPYKLSKTLKRKTLLATVSAGARVEAATLEGPGVIRGLRVKWRGDKDAGGRDLMLKIFWDDEDAPSVWAPLYDFFGGRAKTLAVGRQDDDVHYCYLPMPFARKASLWIENGAESETHRVEISIDSEPLDHPPERLRTFHAQWRRENDFALHPVPYDGQRGEPRRNPALNYDAFKARGDGHVVGAMLNLRPGISGAARVSVDERAWPPMPAGGGAASFFNAAGQESALNRPLCANLGDVNGVSEFLRLFTPFPIDFRTQCEIGFERGPANTLRTDMSSVVYWYQEEPHEPFIQPDPGPAREFRRVEFVQPEWRVEGETASPQPLVIEGETALAAASGGVYEPQDMRPYGPNWSGERQLRFEGLGEESMLEVQAPRFDYSGYYDFECVLTRAPDAPVIQMFVNHNDIFQAIDLYDKQVMPVTYKSSQPSFYHASEIPIVKMILKGRNADSSGWTAGLDCFSLIAHPDAPQSLTVRGPFYLNPAEGETLQAFTPDGAPALPLGFAAKPPKDAVIKPGSSKAFEIKAVSADSDRAEYYLVKMTVEADRAGLYRFDAAPHSSTPFLLSQESDSMKEQPARLLVNGIPLEGGDETLFDAETHQRLPVRFAVPLNQGSNELIWMTRAGVSFTPRVYGLSVN
ncbi:MAG: DUF2961 domain-containing protein [bacterium]|nr:DUF2961 domain-containing protein [bacterium]